MTADDASRRVVWVHPQAPRAPAYGQPCNGCGLCCLTEPCPLGMLVSRRRSGSCAALVWSEQAQAYRCSVLLTPRRFLAWLPEGFVRAIARRWIAAGSGCDAHLQRVDVTVDP